MVHHYRDRRTAEVDIVVEGPDRVRLVEAKAARTASTGLFAGTQRVRDELAQPSRPCEVAVVYGGEEAQCRSDAKLVPRTCLHDEGPGRTRSA